MKKVSFFIVFFMFFIVLFGVGKISFAFQCVGPGGTNCLQCHVRSDIHSFHLGRGIGSSDCTLCHCGINCQLLYEAPVDTQCCATCHPQTYKVNEHTSKGRFDCTACHTSTIGIDNDADGICNPGQSDPTCIGSDNCPETPNGPNIGTCIKGYIGQPCVSNNFCGTGGVCSMDQEDTRPPGGNSCGDACECESDLNGSGAVDGVDTNLYKADYGRNPYKHPCTTDDPCPGDLDCSGSVDGVDTNLYKADYGRNQYNNPCPACSGYTCVYP